MVKIKVGMNLLELLMESEGGRQNILKYADKIRQQDALNKTKDKEANNETKSRKKETKETSFTMELLHDFKKENTSLKYF